MNLELCEPQLSYRKRGPHFGRVVHHFLRIFMGRSDPGSVDPGSGTPFWARSMIQTLYFDSLGGIPTPLKNDGVRQLEELSHI